jgi:hypothetical protein
MAPVIQFDDEEIEEVAAIANNGEKLSEIVKSSAEIGPRVGTVMIARRLSKIVALDFGQLILTVNGLVHVYGTRSELEITTEEAIEALGNSLEKAKAADVLSAWNSAKPKIIEALDALNEEHALIVSHKAGIIASSRPNPVHSMKLFTDTRPVFNESGERVLFTVIGHTLALEYHEEYRHREIQLSLDASDVANLLELCVQADVQAASLKASISGPAGMPFESEDEDHR